MSAKQEYDLALPDEEFQKEVDKWVEGKLGEDLRLPYPERNELIATLREQMHDDVRRKDRR